MAKWKVNIATILMAKWKANILMAKWKVNILMAKWKVNSQGWLNGK